MKIKLSIYDDDMGDSFEPQDDAMAWEENEIFQENQAERRLEEEESSPFWVTVYWVSRQYGGPEEGGWWYDWYELKKSVPASSEEDGKAKMIELRKEFPFDADRLSSVNGDGTNQIYVESSEEKGDMVSTERPRYE